MQNGSMSGIRTYPYHQSYMYQYPSILGTQAQYGQHTQYPVPIRVWHIQPKKDTPIDAHTLKSACTHANQVYPVMSSYIPSINAPAKYCTNTTSKKMKTCPSWCMHTMNHHLLYIFKNSRTLKHYIFIFTISALRRLRFSLPFNLVKNCRQIWL